MILKEKNSYIPIQERVNTPMERKVKISFPQQIEEED